MFAPVDQKIKDKVIAAYLSGQGRNNITRQLNTAGLKVSHGSVSNIIIKYKRQYEQSLQSNTNTNNASVVAPPQPSQEVVQGPPSDAGISTVIPMNISAGSPLLMTCSASAGTGQAQTKSNFNITPRDGGPLSRLLCEDNSTDEEEVIPPLTSYSNLPTSVPPTVSMSLHPNTNIPSNFNPYFNPYQNNINPQISKPETQESPQLKPQPQHQQYHDDNNDSNYDDQEVIDPELKKEFDDSWQKNLFQKIIEGRKEHQQQIQLIERRQQELDEQKRQIENIRQDLEVRENKLRSVEDLIPSSKHLKDIGISFDQALVWVDCIKEVAQKELIDERTAAWKLADMLRSFKDLCGLEKAIQQANQQLALLNMANIQQKHAINTLVHLQQIGMTEDEIGELVKLVGRWNGTGVGVGLSQGNGISSMNGKLDDKLIGVG